MGEVVVKRKHLCTVGENVNWFIYREKQCGVSSEIKIEWAHDPTTPLLSIYLRKKSKTLIWKYIFTPIFIVVLFTITKIWKQPRCPLTDGWINEIWDVVYIYKWNITQPYKRMKSCICNNIHGPRGSYWFCFCSWTPADETSMKLLIRKNGVT